MFPPKFVKVPAIELRAKYLLSESPNRPGGSPQTCMESQREPCKTANALGKNVGNNNDTGRPETDSVQMA